MARGRKKDPKGLHLVRGEQRPSRVNFDEPEAPAGAPKPPDHLAGDGRLLTLTRAAHERIAGALEEMGIASTADFGAVEALASAYAIHALALIDLDARGITVDVYKTDKDGERYLSATVKNPSDTVRHEAATAIRSLGSELGLSPTARAKIRVDPRKPAADPVEGHLAGGGK